VTPDLLQAVFLGALQGATEFLPVSSSGHLVVVPTLLGWGPPSLTFDITAHLATALAVLVFFRGDWWRMLAGFGRGLRAGSPWSDPDGRALVLVAVATLPAGLVGVALEDYFTELFAAPRTVAVMLVVTGAILLTAERLARGVRTPGAVDLPRALAIGAAQAVAIVPGISRSGSTIATGMALGLPRAEAARFSFLMATPIIVGAALLQLAHFLAAGRGLEAIGPLLAGAVVAFAVGYASIGWLLGYVRRRSLTAFGAYAIVFGLASAWLLS